MKIFVETERFLLREMLEIDAPGLYELDSDPEVHRYLGNKPISDMETCYRVVANVRQQYQDNGIGRWSVIDKASGAFVGWSGLKYEMNLRAGMRYYDIGYRLLRKYWGQGIASETAAAALRYGFETLQYPEICAAAQVANIGSNRVLQKIGLQCFEQFDYEGAPTNWYRLSRSDWALAQ